MAVPQVVAEKDESRVASGSSGRAKEEKLKTEIDKAELRVE